MAKQHEKERALVLRKKGHSIQEIAEKLAVSKGTVSVWCRDISLSARQIEILARRTKHHAVEALLKSAEQQRRTRQEMIITASNQGVADIGRLSKRDLFMVGLGLYWGEGYKRGSQELGFTNSDPALVTTYIRWLYEIYSVENDALILRVSINAQHSDRIAEVERYWSKLTHIPLKQFTKSSLIKTTTKRVFSDRSTHFGTLRIKVRRGTNLRRRILGSIAAIASVSSGGSVTK